MPAWQSVGAHRSCVEGNLFVMELHGPICLAELAELLLPQEHLLAQYTSVLTLCDARDASMPSPEVRKFLAERGKRIDTQRLYSVVITGSLLLRTMVQLVERAALLISGSPLRTAFVGCEAEAWKWVAANRQMHPPQRRSVDGQDR